MCFLPALVTALSVWAKVALDGITVTSNSVVIQLEEDADTTHEQPNSGNDDPQAPISGQAMMVMMYKALALKGFAPEASESDLSAFEGDGQVSEYASHAVAALIGEGVIQGDGRRIHPLNQATRADTAVMLYLPDFREVTKK